VDPLLEDLSRLVHRHIVCYLLIVIAIVTMSKSATENEAPIQSVRRKHVDGGNLNNDIDVIYHNMNFTSEAYTFSQQRFGTN
jgi:hypothetical protein